MMTTNKHDDQVETLLHRYREVIQRLYAPESVWLFGSRAAGTASSHSDIDLLVVSNRFGQVRRLRRRSTFLTETGLAHAYELPIVDPLCYTPEEFQTGLHQPTIVAEAVASGIRLLGGNDDESPSKLVQGFVRIGLFGMQLDARVVDQLVRQIVDSVQPLQIMLFGSAARGGFGPDSDIDLLVVMPEGTHRRKTAQKLYREIDGLGVPFDILVATPTDLEQYKDTIGLIYRTVLLEGKVIYAV